MALRLLSAAVIAAGFLPFAAEACTFIEPKGPQPRISQGGEDCRMTYSGGDKPEYRSFGVHRISPEVVQLYISTGNACSTSEQIAVYYDCAKNQAVWFGGEKAWEENGRRAGIDPMELLDPNEITGQPPGPAEYFVRIISPEFAPDYSLDAILAKAKSLEWMPQSGVVNSNRMSVDGNDFNLSCGCRLPQG